ncbi:hypothetical protein GCM10014715_88460 [Streptomyces spiralis]|uniref:Pirin n=1 Tax=Streptomyces spiralis TaxID=66376 RepID=A0A919E778_9ACTN|nr:hypothetical protein GCM10014715_88460 [Streptomyces spiralis]
MDVAPHPHTGLQTVGWLFSGEIEHRDSHAFVGPGELNLMTGGFGISHTEVSTSRTTILHGVRLWVVLPDAHRDAARDFQHYVPDPVRLDGGTARVFLGTLAGCISPVRTFTPLLGAELSVEPGATVTLDVDPEFEHGLLVDTGDVLLNGTVLKPAELGYAAPGCAELTVANEGPDATRLVLLCGPPFGEEIVMWWNFIGRTTTTSSGPAKPGRTPPTASAGSRDVQATAFPPPHSPTPPSPPRRNPAPASKDAR